MPASKTALKQDYACTSFKVNSELPRVQRILGILRGLAPENLLDVGSGRGTFLWPLLAAFPELPVTAVDSSERRSSDLAAVRRGGIERLNVVRMDAEHPVFVAGSFDVVTILEVLEHRRWSFYISGSGGSDKLS
jgi:2-polyprenyl-3-methyl-5-hydroxy-6-metoxy-1,4-benzoquinol methylase